MKFRVYSILLLLICMTPTLLVYGQGPKKARTPADYLPRTLRELFALQPEYVANDPTHDDARLMIHSDLLPSRVKVIYEGEKRSLIEDKKLVINRWANRFAGAPEFYTTPYVTEAMFTEDGVRYWLVVRKEFVPQFEQRLKKGDTVELFLIKLGDVRSDDKLEPVVLVEKFLK